MKGGGVQVPCSCGGTLRAYVDGDLTHTLPTCPDYDRVTTLDDAVTYMKAQREALEKQSAG